MNMNKIIAKVAENWPAKVISIALALIIFVFHRMSSLSERFFSVPLVFISQTNLVPASPYPRTIRISLRGDVNNIYTIQEDDISAYVDLARYDKPGNYQAAIQIQKNGTALDVSPLEIRIEPGEIALSLDHKISKFVPLSANIQGEVEPGYILNSHALNPTQVIIDGPSRLIGNISQLSTDVVDLGGRNGDFVTTVDILNRDPLIIIRGTGNTEFRGFISRIVSVRNIENVPVNVVGLKEGLRAVLDSPAAAVHLEGENQTELDRFVLPSRFLYVDCFSITEPGTYMLKIHGDVPSNLFFTADPPEMKIDISFMEE